MRILILLVFFYFLVSCDGDCQDVVIQTAKWETTTKTASRDTIINYSIVYHKTDRSSFGSTLNEIIVLKNESNSYSGSFGISFNYGEIEYDNQNMNKYWSGYVEIEPQSTHVFSFERQAHYNYNFNSDYKVLSLSKKVNVDVSTDSLIIKDTTINTCKCNVEALKAKYQSINDIFSQKNTKTKAVSTDDEIISKKKSFEKKEKKMNQMRKMQKMHSSNYN